MKLVVYVENYQTLSAMNVLHYQCLHVFAKNTRTTTEQRECTWHIGVIQQNESKNKTAKTKNHTVKGMQDMQAIRNTRQNVWS